jgi:hypothetical protein
MPCLFKEGLSLKLRDFRELEVHQSWRKNKDL